MSSKEKLGTDANIKGHPKRALKIREMRDTIFFQKRTNEKKIKQQYSILMTKFHKNVALIL